MFNFIAEPFGRFLLFLYDLAGNYGVAILIIAVVIKIVLLPFQMKSKRGMMRQSRLQPKIAEIQKKHGANKTKLNEEMTKLYKEEGVNPASGCLWSILPLPIMFALFYVIRQPLTLMMGVEPSLLKEGGALLNKLNEMHFEPTLNNIYVEIEQAQFITAHFSDFARLNIENLREISFNLFPQLNLGLQPKWDFLWTTTWSNPDVWIPGLLLFLIPLISGGSQFVSTLINKKVTPAAPTAEGAGKSMQTMMMLMPLMSVWFGFILPAALGFYWTIGTICQIGQDIWLTKKYTKILDAEEAVRNKQRKKKEAEIEAKRLEAERRKAEGIVVEKNQNTSKRKKHKGEKREQLEKAAEWVKKNAPVEAEETHEPSRVGNRRFARGRAYDPDRYANEAAAAGEGESDASVSEDKTDIEDDAYEAVESEIDDNEEDDEDEEDEEYEEYDEDGDEDEDESEDENEDGNDDIPPDDTPPDDGSDGSSAVKFDTKRFEDD